MKRAAIASFVLCVALRAVGGAPPAQTRSANPNTVPVASAHAPVVLTPQYAPGDILRYQVSLRSQTRSLVGGAVENRQGASELGISVGLTLRLEALAPIPVGAAPAARRSPGSPAAVSIADRPPLRLRATYERVSAELLGDAYDPSAAKLLAPYKNLEGRAIEFQFGPHGEVEYMRGLDEVVQDARALEAARSWLEQLGAGLGAPVAGVAPGQSWERTQAVPEAPLNGTRLQSSSTYLRDEPCDVQKPEGEQCAVVLMKFSLGQKPGEKNSTPEAFRKNGLRTSGQWSSQGESLVYVSLQTGRTVSVTQSSEELMDLSIRHENGGMPFRYSGHSRNETHLLLLDEKTTAR